MRVAVIDLGTNTFNLLIADVQQSDFRVVHAGREVVKLGEASINEGRIAEAAYRRGIEAFMNHARVIREKNAATVRAFATSAIRDAQNGRQFTDEILQKTGIEIEVIDGEREAELIYLGNRLAVDLRTEAHLIMDIGGGSTEFIIANHERIFWKKSFRLGVARLLEKFKPEDPISAQTITAVRQYLAQELQPLVKALAEYRVNCLVGSSGGFESVVDMIAAAYAREEVVDEKHCYRVSLGDYFNMSQRVVHSTAAERERMGGLIPMRRDMIVLTYLLIDEVVALSGVREFKVSTYALKEGALAELIVNNC
jgi:exopolyphosphatase / guanosine-5'-triphosphate,3'-diphosphate pyrophosphatase